MAKNKGAAERAVLTVREAADVLGIGINQAYEAIRARQIPSIRISEKRIIVPRVALEKMLAGEEGK
jgi:excisionase family DNA binding protein